MSELKANFVSAADTLIIRSRVATDPANPAADRFFTWEIEQKARTWGEVQKLLDGLNDDRETIAAVWRVEPDSNGIPRIEDVTEFFDVRTVDEIEEDVRHVEAVAERRYTAHASQGQQFGGNLHG
ncbi:hypothetical protein [Ensifer canadensis]|uniref:hypothetical protein n=1 Tax=Ensifer canadensis TaxID=555315 RepID=UPI0035E3C863